MSPARTRRRWIRGRSARRATSCSKCSSDSSIQDVDARRAAVDGDVAEVARLFIEDDALPCREDETLDVAFDGEKFGAIVRKANGHVARRISDVADGEACAAGERAEVVRGRVRLA